MKFQLKELELVNFKRIRSLRITFQQITNLLAQNGKGKTTVLDAFLWLLFGKDSTNRTDFEIKTLDNKNEPYHKLSHEVNGQFDIDGQDVSIKRIYREKWTKPKGKKDEVFSGHETLFFWNDVPLSEKEFTAKIASFINESQFKLLTNLGYFNTVMKWQDRRGVLLQLAGGINDMDIAVQLNTEGQYDHLIKALNDKKTIEEYRKQLVAKRNKIREESENLDARIDEARRGLPEDVNYSELETQLNVLNTELSQVDELMTNKSAAEKQYQEMLTSLVREQQELQRSKMSRENDVRNEVKDKGTSRLDAISEAKRLLRSLQSEKDGLLGTYNSREAERVRLVNEKQGLVKTKELVGENWDRVNAEVFVMDPSACTCPTCKQTLPGTNAEELENTLRTNFNQDKAKRLEDITTKGVNLNGDIEKKTAEIKLKETEAENIKAQGLKKNEEIIAQQNAVSILEEEHTRLNTDEDSQVKTTLGKDSKIQEIVQRLSALDEQINTPKPAGDNSELLSRKRGITEQITSINQKLANKGLREKGLQRISELEKQDSESAQAIADIEGMEFSILEFDKAKMDLLEAKINGRFQLVKFKLFDRQINGGETPACVTLIDGVPYPDANTASRINASLDIINVFAAHYGVKAPVFIDNRESVTRIIDTDLQIINLVVSPEHDELQVVDGDMVKEFA